MKVIVEVTPNELEEMGFDDVGVVLIVYREYTGVAGHLVLSLIFPLLSILAQYQNTCSVVPIAE